MFDLFWGHPVWLTDVTAQSLTCSDNCVWQCLRLELNDVTNAGAPEHLYPFMQFLKSEAAVNVLQFCLACGQ